MIDKPTVLVLGAGASCHYGFPTGQSLKDHICDETLRSWIKQLSRLGISEQRINEFKAALVNSGRTSVDAFLEYRGDFLDIGKATIALALLHLENPSALFLKRIHKRLGGKHEGKKAEGNWYDYLFSVLSDGVPFDDFDKNKLSIITFNYDRSIEQYLFTALKNSYGRDDNECSQKLGKIPIVHVHGSLGRLPWQPAVDPEIQEVRYDSSVEDSNRIKCAADSIKIIPEGTRDTPEFLRARKLIFKAEQLYFLGFGYHPTNLKRLGVDFLERLPSKIMGTTLGLSLARERNLQRTFASREISIKLIPENVYTFLHNFVDFNES